MFNKIAVNLMVPNVTEALSFYEETLGLTRIVTVPDEVPFQFALLQGGADELMLQSVDSLRTDIPEIGVRPIGGSFVIYIDVDGIDELYDRLNGKVEIVVDVRTTHYRMKEFYIKDPYGYVFGFAQKAD